MKLALIHQESPQENLQAYSNTKLPIRMGLIVILVGLVGFLLWAAFAPLDEGVPTNATVSVETSRKAVQHLGAGIIKKVLVKEGQEVKLGQVLIELDQSNTKARYEEIKQHYLGLRAQESRLMAEKSGASTIQFHQDLMQYQADPYIQQHMINQSQLLMAKQQALASEVSAVNESIQGYKAQIEGYQGVLSSYQSQLALLNEQLSGIKELVKEGYAPRNQQNDLEQKMASVHGQIAEVQANIMRNKKSILELGQRINALKQNDKKLVDTEMAQVKLEVQSDGEKFKALEDELNRLSITAPATGQVVGLQVQTLGGVIQAGQKLMDIVPQGETLILDAQVPPHLIDKVHAGQTVDVRFSSFANTPQLLVEGKLDTISKDLLTEQLPNQATNSYYLARISITAAGMKALGNRTLQAGMPAQVIIKTGERTLLTYILHPLSKRIAASMKEE